MHMQIVTWLPSVNTELEWRSGEKNSNRNTVPTLSYPTLVTYLGLLTYLLYVNYSIMQLSSFYSAKEIIFTFFDRGLKN